MKPPLKLDFADFWQPFDKADNYFFNLLKDHYEIELTSRPDFLICSVFGEDYRRYDCVRVVFIGENVRPDFAKYDYSFSFDYLDTPRNYRLPLYALYGDASSLARPKPPFEEIAAEKTRFCNMVVSNAAPQERIEFFRKLSRYKRVDSGGLVLNNTGYAVPDKVEFIRHYKFTIAFENGSHPGYTTEKIFEPMLVHSTPIYWGNPLVERDFNTRSFINVHDFADLDGAVERVVAVDSDPALYRAVLAQPYFTGNRVNPYVSRENVLRQFAAIFARGSGALLRGLAP